MRWEGPTGVVTPAPKHLPTPPVGPNRIAVRVPFHYHPCPFPMENGATHGWSLPGVV
jgi:hypothetical protein